MNRVNRLSQHLTASVDVDRLDPKHVESQAQVMRALAASQTAAVFRDPREGEVRDLQASSLFGVEGKVALVTGGSRGIGRMIAAGLAANGAKVYISSRKANVCDQTAKELNAEYAANGGEVISLPGDVSSIETVIALADALKALEPKLDILINNAGVTWGGELEEYPDKAWQKVMDVNVRHLFNLTVKLLPLLQASASAGGSPARVVNIASVDGVRATQTNGPFAAFAYTASKGAVVHLTKALCRALSPYKITVNCLAPGMFPSNMTSFAIKEDTMLQQAETMNPLGRIGRTSDMAGAALFLVSKAGSWINGNTIVVDGGGFLH